MLTITIILSIILIKSTESYDLHNIDIPPEHLPYYLNQWPEIINECQTKTNCEFTKYVNKTKCWGYEDTCSEENRYSTPECTANAAWIPSSEAQSENFWNEGDFGYVKQQIQSLKLMCEPKKITDSSLLCSDHLRFCVGRNLMMNFTSLSSRTEPIRYKMDVLGDGDIGGHCKFHKNRLLEQADHVSPLQSWAPELRYFRELKKPVRKKTCDIYVDKPTFIMKIDAAVNMYHHFCDFFNLYASQHVNSTHFDMFTRDTQILIWETYAYSSVFARTFDAFTMNPIWDLTHVSGKVVCFKNVVFPLLPRMIFGLFYNTPLTPSCEKSGLFHAFSKHILHRLRVKRKPRTNKRVRVTFLSRKTKYRNVLNEQELIDAISRKNTLSVKRVVYDSNFLQQLETTYNTDILIGMHGAGLTHLLFLPDWAVIFELYHCDDPQCYSNLARLRGVRYQTWTNSSLLYQQDEGHHPDGGSHPKFTNYAFDVDEFVRLVVHAADYVKNHKKFRDDSHLKRDEL